MQPCIRNNAKNDALYKDFIKIHPAIDPLCKLSFTPFYFCSSQFDRPMLSPKKVSFAGLLIALGIIYGDIGTSPLYVLNAIMSGKLITDELVVGALSLIIWTLTLQTTIKYVIL